MTFDYGSITGPIDFRNDSEEVRNCKAGHGAFVYALGNAGWSEEQIAAVLSAHILDQFIGDKRGRGTVSAWQVAQEAAAAIHPRSSPCGRPYCTTCQPKST